MVSAIKQLLIPWVNLLPYVRGLAKENERLKAEVKKWQTWMPPGHYYSPIPSIPEIKGDNERIFKKHELFLSDIQLNENAQLELLGKLSAFNATQPFTREKAEQTRYYFENDFYSYADGIVLYSMLRHFQPKRVIEVGSGFSSALTLDVNEIFFDHKIKLTFIEPYPHRLETLMNERDREQSTVIVERLQDVSLSLFTELCDRDILLIDSSHVSKTGSDVNTLIFEILPRLQSGVFVHIHDIFFPFEYPKDWVLGGMAWNEAYLIRAFLQYNQAFEICFFTSFLMNCHKERVKHALPLAIKSEKDDPTMKDTPGASLWIRKK